MNLRVKRIDNYRTITENAGLAVIGKISESYRNNKEENSVEISFKNISNYELDFNTEDIFESLNSALPLWERFIQLQCSS